MRSAILLLCFAFGSVARADVPAVLGYQGHLAHASGGPVNNTVSMTFRIYASSAGGEALWEESHNAVQVSNGSFHILLGSVVPIDLPFDQPYYLGISVGGDLEMSARLAIGSAAYAVRARATDTVTGAAIVTSDIEDASVAPDRLGNFCEPGQVLVRTAETWGCGLAP